MNSGHVVVLCTEEYAVVIQCVVFLVFQTHFVVHCLLVESLSVLVEMTTHADVTG